jgi:hypothetical protein
VALPTLLTHTPYSAGKHSGYHIIIIIEGVVGVLALGFLVLLGGFMGYEEGTERLPTLRTELQTYKLSCLA